MSFCTCHEAAAEKFTQAHVEVCFDERDASDAGESGGAGVFGGEWLGDGFPARKGLTPFEAEVRQCRDVSKECRVPEEGSVEAVVPSGW